MVITTPETVLSQPDSISVKKKAYSKYKIEAGCAYLIPIHANRQIQTINAHIMAGKQFFKKIHLALYSGIIVTYAWGHIVQLNDFYEEVAHENSAFGAGPLFLLRFEPFVVNRIALGIDASGVIAFYTKHFPAGGDFYNFMWRIGPILSIKMNNGYTLGMGYRWMHVSNGQGLGPRNPSYEGEGPFITFGKYF